MTGTVSKVLVTGASGFIGKHLCTQLVDSGYEVITYQRNISGQNTSDESSKIQHIAGDINDSVKLRQALTGVSGVFHLAGIAHVDEPDTQKLQSINVSGTENLLNSARAAGVKKIVYFSSSMAADVEHEPGRQTTYARTKYQAEQSLLGAQADTGPDVCILRPVNVYGVGMQGNLMALVKLIRKRRLPPLPKVENCFSLIGVEDLCAAAIAALQNPISSGKTYLITDGKNYTINEVERAIYQALGRQKPNWHTPRVVLYVASAMAEIAVRIFGAKSSIGRRTYHNLVGAKTFSNALICEQLGFNPKQDLYTALPYIIANCDTNTMSKAS